VPGRSRGGGGGKEGAKGKIVKKNRKQVEEWDLSRGKGRRGNRTRHMEAKEKAGGGKLKKSGGKGMAKG